MASKSKKIRTFEPGSSFAHQAFFFTIFSSLLLPEFSYVPTAQHPALINSAWGFSIAAIEVYFKNMLI